MVSQRQFLLTADQGPQRFLVLITAFAYLPANHGHIRTIEQYEVEAEIKQELYRISIETAPNTREYKGGDQYLTLTPGQIELLRSRIVAYPFFSPLAADVVAETYRWLGTEGALPLRPSYAAETEAI